MHLSGNPATCTKCRYIAVMERLVEPERMVAFRVAWVDDKGKQQVMAQPADPSLLCRAAVSSAACLFVTTPRH